MLGIMRTRGFGKLFSGLGSIFNSGNSKPKDLDLTEKKVDKVSKSILFKIGSWFSSWFSSSSTTNKSIATQVAVVINSLDDNNSDLSISSISDPPLISSLASSQSNNDWIPSFVEKELSILISEGEKSEEIHKQMYKELKSSVTHSCSNTKTYKSFEEIPKLVEKDFNRNIPPFELTGFFSSNEARAQAHTVINKISSFSKNDTNLRNIILLSLTQNFGNSIVNVLNEFFMEKNSSVAIITINRSIKWEKTSSNEFKGTFSIDLNIKDLNNDRGLIGILKFTYFPKLTKTDKGDWQLELDHATDRITYKAAGRAAE